MGTFRDDPDFWRFPAEEVRIKSRQVKDFGLKRAVQEVASEYERLACRIEKRATDWRSARPRWPNLPAPLIPAPLDQPPAG
jgi:hypothetical protein